MKKQYVKPSIEEYGTLAALTLGATGTKPEILNGVKQSSQCIPSNPHVTSCNIAS